MPHRSHINDIDNEQFEFARYKFHVGIIDIAHCVNTNKLLRQIISHPTIMTNTFQTFCLRILSEPLFINASDIAIRIFKVNH